MTVKKQHQMTKRIIWLTGLLFCGSLPAAVDVADPGFETHPPGTDLSTGITIFPALLTGWGIDSYLVSSAENGIIPFEGSQMARANVGASSYLYTLNDLAPISDPLANGQSLSNVSPHYN